LQRVARVSDGFSLSQNPHTQSQTQNQGKEQPNNHTRCGIFSIFSTKNNSPEIIKATQNGRTTSFLDRIQGETGFQAEKILLIL
jgi:hypothetical protein